MACATWSETFAFQIGLPVVRSQTEHAGGMAIVEGTHAMFCYIVALSGHPSHQTSHFEVSDLKSEEHGMK